MYCLLLQTTSACKYQNYWIIKIIVIQHGSVDIYLCMRDTCEYTVMNRYCYGIDRAELAMSASQARCPNSQLPISGPYIHQRYGSVYVIDTCLHYWLCTYGIMPVKLWYCLMRPTALSKDKNTNEMMARLKISHVRLTNPRFDYL